MTQIVFVSIFCYKFWKINDQLGNFFFILKDDSYPYKTVKVAFGLFFIIKLNAGIAIIIDQYFELENTKLYFMISTYVNGISSQFFMLC